MKTSKIVFFLLLIAIMFGNSLCLYAQTKQKIRMPGHWNFILKVKFDSLVVSSYYDGNFFRERWFESKQEKGYLWKVSNKEVLHDIFTSLDFFRSKEWAYDVRNINYIVLNYQLSQTIVPHETYVIACQGTGSTLYIRGLQKLDTNVVDTTFYYNFHYDLPNITVPTPNINFSAETPRNISRILYDMGFFYVCRKLKIKASGKIFNKPNPYRYDVFEFFIITGGNALLY